MFHFKKLGHIITRCPEKKNYRSGHKYKSRRDEDNKDYKDKGKKSCYIFKEEIRYESDDHDNEVVYVAMKDESNEDEAIAILSCVMSLIVDVHIT